MNPFKPYKHSAESIQQRIDDILSQTLPHIDRQKALRTILSCIDLTTLEGADTHAKVEQMAQKALAFKDEARKVPAVAAVCVYPTLVATAAHVLADTPLHVASVAGAFPAGQSPIDIKVAEVRYAVAQGAHEIDMVISRATFLEGQYEVVAEEVRAIKQACGKAHLKVILETGELKTVENIRKASEICILAGADFIKTSTGKIAEAATLPAFLVMIDTIKEYYQATGKMIGIKPAGGISDTETALQYYALLEEVLGEPWLNNTYFRVGASRLADKVLAEIL